MALALLIPGIARLTTAPTIIDAALFYLIGVVIYGTVLSLILYLWGLFRKTL